MTFSRAFVYAGVFALHVAVCIGDDVWVHRTPWTGVGKNMAIGGGVEELLNAVKARGAINPAHWERLGSTSWRP